jgi:hypothetical protein
VTTTASKPTITLESLGFNMTPQAPSKLWSKQKFIMLGESKVGKTKFWAGGGEKAFFFRTEAGHNHVSTIGADCRSFSDIMEWKTKLMQAKAGGIFPFETVVFDTGDRLIDYIQEDVLEWARSKYSKQADSIVGIGDVPEGNGWFILKQKVNQFLKQLEELPCASVLVFHTAQDTRNDDGQTGKTYKKDTINVGGKAGTALLAWADHILHVRAMYVGDIMARKMITRGSKTVEAGSRAGLPPSVTWAEDDAKNFQEFRKLFE